jgi:hypothetical protein
LYAGGDAEENGEKDDPVAGVSGEDVGAIWGGQVSYYEN